MNDDTQAGPGDWPTDLHPPEDDPTPDRLAWSETEPEPIWVEEPRHGRVVPLVGAILLGAIAIPAAILAVGHQPRDTHPDASPVTTTLTPAAPSPEAAVPEARPSYDLAGPPAEHMVPPAPPAEPTPDERYLALLAGDGWNITDPLAAETAGKIACHGLYQTHNLYATEVWLHNTYGVLPAQAHEITIAASVVYCPEIPG